MNGTETLIYEFFNIDFFSQLVATLIGAGIGFGTALYVNSRNGKQSIKNRKHITINAIHEELLTAKKAIDKTTNHGHIKWKHQDLEFQGGWISISTPAFHSAINSGDFSLFDTDLQTEIGNVYLSMDELHMFNQQRMQFPFSIVMQSSDTKKVAENIAHDFNTTVDRFHDELEKVLPKLAKELST